MLFYLRNKNKTIKTLRKNVGYTVNELSLKAKLNSSMLHKIDNRKLKEIPKELQDRLIPIFRGDYSDRMPW